MGTILAERTIMLTFTEQTEIYKQAILGFAGPASESQEAAAFRSSCERDARKAKHDGVMLDIPCDWDSDDAGAVQRANEQAEERANSYDGHIGRPGMIGGSFPRSASAVAPAMTAKLTGMMNRKGGFTYHPAHGVLNPKTGYAVASHIEVEAAHDRVKDGQFNKAVLQSFCDKNKDLLSHDAKANVGGWVDKDESGDFCLDIVHVYDSKQDAYDWGMKIRDQQEKMGRQKEQGMWDFSANGGKGGFLSFDEYDASLKK
jgi:hypothetical protein